MKVSALTGSVAGVFLFGLGVATAQLAQKATDSAQRVEQKRTQLTGAPRMEVIVSVAEYKPGDSLALHTHHGVEAAYVVQGASVQYAGKEPVTLSTGATVLNLRDVQHAGFTVVGDTPLKLFSVHIVDQGKPLYEFAQ
jgi:quercetin dioxygenase-like cupin family protein